MNKKIRKIFEDNSTQQKLSNKLPKMFQLAELESSRAGKIGMEVGSLRERVIIAFLIYRFGKENVNSDLEITFPETDVLVYDTPISIKTMTSKNIIGFKVSWTVDSESSTKFLQNYSPECDIIYVRINWGYEGNFYYIPKEAQIDLINKIGVSEYLKLPKRGTNPRGIEISNDALRQLVLSDDTISIPIDWKREDINYNAYERWIDLWKQE